MPASLPFRLKVPGKDEVKDFIASSISYRFHGRLWLEGPDLHLQWTGEAHVQEAGALEARDEKLALPTEELIVPVIALYRATLDGGWLRPRLTLQARALRALSIVPSEEGGTVKCWIARRERHSAAAMAEAINQAIAASEITTPLPS